MIDLKQCSLGIELGSTRIKAVLVGNTCKPVAQGDFTWENRLENGIWTYPLEEVWQGVQAAYAALAADVLAKCGQPLTTVGCIGVSAMMHGYLAFDAAGKLLVPFRTWRNTMTGAAAEELTSAFGFNIPQRWSAAHLYQAMLNREPHLPQLDFFTTLAGYVHWQLTGRKVLGEGDASGMFPIDSTTGEYDAAMLAKFNALADKQGCPVDLVKLLPTVLPAGVDAGMLTVEGRSGSTQPARCSPAYRSAHRRATPAPAWWQQTVSPRAPAMSAQAPAFCHGRPGKAAVQGLPGNRHGHDPRRRGGRHGPLQQLHQRFERLGRSAGRERGTVRSRHRQRCVVYPPV